jgi:hypothetical protein
MGTAYLYFVRLLKTNLPLERTACGVRSPSR